MDMNTCTCTCTGHAGHAGYAGHAGQAGDAQFKSWTRLHEKQGLQDLHNRFGLYLKRAKELRQGSGQVDSSMFLNSMKALEEEMMNIRNMYEKELDGLRIQLENMSKEKGHYKMQADKGAQVAQQHQDRLSSEVAKSRRQLDEFNNLQRALALKSSELEQARLAIKGPLDELEHLRREHENLLREFDTFKRRWDNEQRSRQAAEDKAEQLRQQLNFQAQVNSKQENEMKGRLNVASNSILALEAQIRDLSGKTDADNNLAEKLARVRLAADEEFRKYKEESEAEFAKNLNTLKIQIEASGKQLGEYQKENARLNALVDDANSKLAQIQGQVTGLLHEKNAAEEALSLERTRAAEQVRALQLKLNGLHDMLIAKMKQFNESRDMQIPLKAEIEALRILLEEEEKRHHASGIGASNAANVASTLSFSHYKPHAAAPIPSYGIGQPTGYVGGTRYSAGATGYAATTTAAAPAIGAATGYHLSYGATIPPVCPSHGEFRFEEKIPYKPAPVPQFEDRPESLKQVYSDMAKLKGLEKAVQDAAGQVEYPYDFRAPVVGPVRSRSAPDQGERPMSSTSHDFTTATSSYTGHIRILEIHPKGKYIRLENVNKEKEYELGEFMVQQNVGGHTVAVFRFPKRTKLSPNSTVTIWSGTNDPLMHQPPTDFVFEEQQRWGTGPECTTILSKPNGQAISWMTAAHRFAKDAYEANSTTSVDEGEKIAEMPVDQQQDHKYLRREKMEKPNLAANRHPHGLETGNQAHPSTGQPRPLAMGNDNSTFSRQSRTQSRRPDPVPGQPYAGASGQRMGSGPLRKYMATDSTVRGSGAVANKSAGEIRFGQPTPFLSPLQQECANRKGEHASTMVRFPACKC